MARLNALLAGFTALIFSSTAAVADPDPTNWQAVEKAAKGQTLYFNAWGGEPRINAYIAWAGEQVKARYGVTVEHVKLTNTADAVARVTTEKAAGKTDGGSVDMIWINGENFANMKRSGLLFKAWGDKLPNYALIDPNEKPAVAYDFTVPVEGDEAPWDMAQLVYIYDSAHLPSPPKSMAALLAWAEKEPGRFTYPLVPNFLGTTFLKQALYEVIADRSALSRPVDSAKFANQTAPLWAYLDKLHPNLWRKGRHFPANSTEQRALINDGEIAMALSFNPLEATAGILADELPKSTRTAVFDGGTIANANFVAIPFNSGVKEGAMVFANFLMSPEAQARKQDPEYWGGLTVLDVADLPPAEKARFDALDLGEASLTPDKLGPTLAEPHPSWAAALEKEWLRRYGSGG